MTTAPALDPSTIVTALLDRIDDPRATVEQLATTAVELDALRTQLTAKEAEYAALAATAEKFGITTTQLRAAGLPAPTHRNTPRTARRTTNRAANRRSNTRTETPANGAGPQENAAQLATEPATENAAGNED